MEKTAEQLTFELEQAKAELSMLLDEYNGMKTHYFEMRDELQALERAFELKDKALEEEHARAEELQETLARERRRFAQGDTLRFLEWRTQDVKGSEMVLITGHKAGAKHIVIPEEIEGLPVIGVEEDAFANCDTLESVDLPYGTRAVAERAFLNCTNLQTARLPKSVVWMGKDSFDGSRQCVLVCEPGSYADWYADYHKQEKQLVTRTGDAI